MLGRATLSAMYRCRRANRGDSSAARTTGAAPGAKNPTSSVTDMRRRSRMGITAASAIDHCGPAAKPPAGGSRAWSASSAASMASGGPPMRKNAFCAGSSSVSTAVVKRRARARSTGAEGRRCAAGKRSARNSRMTSDSGILMESGEGASSGCSSGPP